MAAPSMDGPPAPAAAPAAPASSLDLLTSVKRSVLKIEEACLSGREPGDSDLAQLEAAAQGVRGPRSGLAGKDLVVLFSFGHRLWQVCAAESISSLPVPTEARLRQIACELFASGCSGSQAGRHVDEQAVLAPHWALAGRAWTLAGDDAAAVRCFDAAAQPFETACASAPCADRETSVIRLAEAALQAYLWASRAHFRQDSFDLAFSAISKARDTLEASSELRRVAGCELVALCHEQALAHRSAGRVRLSIELLTLALSALPSKDAKQDCSVAKGAAPAVTMRVRLMRHLAVCYAHYGQLELAAAHAREAIELGPPDSAEQAASLQVLLRVLCEREDRDISADDGDAAGPSRGARAAALDLVRHPAASVEDCLGTCMHLVRQKWPPPVIFEFLAELSSRLRGDARAQCEVLRLRLQIAVDLTEAALQTADAEVDGRLGDVVADAPALISAAGAAGAGLRKAAASVLWRLGGHAVRAGRHGLAARLLEDAVAFVETPEEVAQCWAAVAACSRWAGEGEKCSACVEKALALDGSQLHATLLATLCSVEEGGAEGTRALLQRASELPGVLPRHLACMAQALAQQPPERAAELRSGALEALARCLARAASPGLGGERAAADLLGVVAELMAQAEARALPTPELVRHLGRAEQGLQAHGEALARGLAEGAGPGAAALGRILQAAWARGQQHGRDEDWAASTDLFEALGRVLDRLDASDARALLQARAWCNIMIASAAVQTLKSSGGKREVCGDMSSRALQVLDRAHQLCQRMAQPQADVGAAGAGEQGNGGDRIFMVLVLLEFEVRCMSGDSETQLKNFVDEASTQQGVGAKSLLAMSKIAGASSSRRVAVHCLQRYLRIFLGAHGAANYAQCAVAYRELIALHTSRNESFDVYDGILHLLGSAGVGAVQLHPKQEIAWLASTAWNNGCHFYRLQQYKWAERWMGKSLEFLKYCSGMFPEDAMTKSYVECLQLGGE